MFTNPKDNSLAQFSCKCLLHWETGQEDRQEVLNTRIPLSTLPYMLMHLISLLIYVDSQYGK